MPPAKIVEIAVVVGLLIGLSVGVTATTMFVIGRCSGWQRLAHLFPVVPPAPGATRGFGSIGMGYFGGYNNCVVWKTDDEHLHLALIPPFNWMWHPPMSIPWAAIEFPDPKPRFGLIKADIQGTTFRFPPRIIARELELRQAIAAEAAPATAST